MACPYYCILNPLNIHNFLHLHLSFVKTKLLFFPIITKGRRWIRPFKNCGLQQHFLIWKKKIPLLTSPELQLISPITITLQWMQGLLWEGKIRSTKLLWQMTTHRATEPDSIDVSPELGPLHICHSCLSVQFHISQHLLGLQATPVISCGPAYCIHCHVDQ